MKWFVLALFCPLMMVCSGCSTPFSEREQQAAFAGDGITPLLRPGYVISVSVVVAGQKEIDEPAKRVTDGGDLSLPLLGSVSVTNMTLSDVVISLTDKYREYFVNPQVMVDFAKDIVNDGISPWGYVTVMGRVVKPGRVSIPPTRTLTVSQAIQNAGGFSTSAQDSSIRVTRMTNGKKEVKGVDMKALGRDGKAGEDLLLQPGDIIFVPESIW